MRLGLYMTAPDLLQLFRHTAVAQIVGEAPLPWEEEGREKELLKRAGRFRHAVMQLLVRDPEERCTIDTFMQQCANVLSTTTQQQGKAAPPQRSELPLRETGQ